MNLISILIRPCNYLIQFPLANVKRFTRANTAKQVEQASKASKLRMQNKLRKRATEQSKQSKQRKQSGVCVCVCLCVCVALCVYVCVCVSRARVRVCLRVFPEKKVETISSPPISSSSLPRRDGASSTNVTATSRSSCAGCASDPSCATPSCVTHSRPNLAGTA